MAVSTSSNQKLWVVSVMDRSRSAAAAMPASDRCHAPRRGHRPWRRARQPSVPAAAAPRSRAVRSPRMGGAAAARTTRRRPEWRLERSHRVEPPQPHRVVGGEAREVVPDELVPARMDATAPVGLVGGACPAPSGSRATQPSDPGGACQRTHSTRIGAAAAEREHGGAAVDGDLRGARRGERGIRRQRQRHDDPDRQEADRRRAGHMGRLSPAAPRLSSERRPHGGGAVDKSGGAP